MLSGIVIVTAPLLFPYLLFFGEADDIVPTRSRVELSRLQNRTCASHQQLLPFADSPIFLCIPGRTFRQSIYTEFVLYSYSAACYAFLERLAGICLEPDTRYARVTEGYKSPVLLIKLIWHVNGTPSRIRTYITWFVAKRFFHQPIGVWCFRVESNHRSKDFQSQN